MNNTYNGTIENIYQIIITDYLGAIDYYNKTLNKLYDFGIDCYLYAELKYINSKTLEVNFFGSWNKNLAGALNDEEVEYIELTNEVKNELKKMGANLNLVTAAQLRDGLYRALLKEIK